MLQAVLILHMLHKSSMDFRLPRCLYIEELFTSILLFKANENAFLTVR